MVSPPAAGPPILLFSFDDMAAGPPSFFCHVHFHFEMALEAVVRWRLVRPGIVRRDFYFEMALEAVV